MNLAHLFICTGPTCVAELDRQNISKIPIDTEQLKKAWKDNRLYGTIHLTFTGCLGHCNKANQALLITNDKAPQYFMRLEANGLIDVLVDWGKTAAKLGTLPPLPSILNEACYERLANQ